MTQVHLAEDEYGFDHVGTNCIDLYQMYLVVLTIRGGIPYVGVGNLGLYVNPCLPG